MQELNSKNLSCLTDWLNFIINQKEVHSEDLDVTLNAYGAGDDSYLVANHYINDSECFEYTFLSASSNKLLSLLESLSEVSFSLKSLIDYLSSADKKEDEAGFYIDLKEIKIYVSHLK